MVCKVKLPEGGISSDDPQFQLYCRLIIAEIEQAAEHDLRRQLYEAIRKTIDLLK
jgi:hypothetical protein